MQSLQVSKLFKLMKLIKEYRATINPDKEWKKQQRHNLRMKIEILNEILSDLDKTIKKDEPREGLKNGTERK